MTRCISWIRAAKKDFKKFPIAVQDQMKNALDIAALGQKADIAKSLRGLATGILEIALCYKTGAYGTIYTVQLDEDIWVDPCLSEKVPNGYYDS